MFLQLKVTYSFLYSNVYPMDKRAVEWLFDLFDDSNNLEIKSQLYELKFILITDSF